MMRNFTMAFGAVTLRIYLGIFSASGVPFQESYPVVAWLSWVPNLLIVEWVLLRTGMDRTKAQTNDIAKSRGAAQTANL